MTETDNPDVKAHIEPKKNTDQFLKRMTELDDNDKDLRNYYESREIKPIVVIGRYDKATGKYVLGSWRDSMTPASSWTTTSIAALTLTCAAGHCYRVYYAGCQNATQATTASLTATIGGNAQSNLTYPGALITYRIILIGASTNWVDAVAGSSGATSIKEIWLNAGDTLTMTLSVFAAGNDTEHVFLYEDYTL